MNNLPFSLLQRPALWQRSTAPFWDDEHISKGMLDAHLNPGWDAASRRAETIERTVAWLSSLIPAGVRLLDLGCGPGLYTQRLAGRGYAVTGMDYSKRSIAYAKEHDPKSEYFYQNYLELDVSEAYDAATLIYCDYAALTEAERKVLLANVRRALKPDGLFVLDVFTTVAFRRKSEATTWSACENGGFYSPKPYLCLEATYLYENDTVAADRHVVVTEDGVTEHIVWDTAYTVQKLTDELTAAGLRVEAMYGDTCGTPYAEGSETLCCVARK